MVGLLRTIIYEGYLKLLLQTEQSVFFLCTKKAQSTIPILLYDMEDMSF